MKIRGRVKKGLKIGRELGYPTANLECDSESFPAPGVYAAHATMGSKRYEAVCVIGAREDEGKPLVEVHLFNFQGNAYGQILEVELYDKVSDIGKLDTHLLVQKIQDDIAKVRDWFLSESSKVSKSGKSST